MENVLTERITSRDGTGYFGECAFTSLVLSAHTVLVFTSVVYVNIAEEGISDRGPADS